MNCNKLIYYSYKNSIIENFTNNKRVLLTDFLFPSKYALWRLVEIHSFINKYDTDIMILTKVKNHNHIIYNFDYDEIKDKFNLKDYDILIFNPEFNYINKYNDIKFDGTSYNKLYECDYMFRKKIYRNEIFDVNNYNFVYHIFLYNYNLFNKLFKYPYNKQGIHLYPGGGLTKGFNEIAQINKGTRIISTQNFISEELKKHNYSYANIFGGPFYYKNDKIKRKVFNSKIVTVCFTSMGDIYEKGADKYIELVDLYYNTQKNLELIKFISIGNCPPNKNITSLDKMDQNVLSDYYYQNVDILINLDSGKEINGFPLGTEALMQGCILLTTDIFDSNKLNNFNFDEFIIINRDNLDNIVEKLNKLLNINYRQNLSYKLQDKTFNLFNYENQMVKIFNYIMS